MASNFSGAPDPERDAARLRQSLARLWRHLRAADASSELTPTQASLLSTVVRRGRLGLSELSRIEGLNAPMLSRAVARLEGRGLFRRRIDPHDRRAATVEPTPAGVRLLQRLRSERNDVLRARLALLSEEERRLLHDALPVLETLAEGLKQEAGRDR